MGYLPHLRFVEQYDPHDETTKSQPYAYVADVVHEVALGIDIDEIRQIASNTEQQAALTELRDQLAQGEKLSWYVVVCGDEERSFSGPPTPVADPASRSNTGTWYDDGSKRSMTPTSSKSHEGREENTQGRVRRIRP